MKTGLITYLITLCLLMALVDGFGNMNLVRQSSCLTGPMSRRQPVSRAPSLRSSEKEISFANIEDVVTDLLPTDFPSVLESDTVMTAVKNMKAAGRGSCLVVDEDKKFVGIFTERDFVNGVFENNNEDDASSASVKTVMTPKDSCMTVLPSTSLAKCRQIMLKFNKRRVPVVDSNNNAYGVISLRDIVFSLQKEDKQRLLYGPSVKQAVKDAKVRANELALDTENSGLGKQDLYRTGFVVTGATIAAALLQGTWVHEHEVLTMTATFVLGYIGIIFETFFEFNKAAIGLLMATALWVIFAGSAGVNGIPAATALADLSGNLADVSEIVFFLLGAMTIVEIVDAHQGFKVVTDFIDTKNKRSLMWVIGILTFFMSAILDNLTTTIVMVSLIKKILADEDDRKLFGAMIVIAANAGGAWTPIGDVTTTMLWIDGQITALPTMTSLLLPSLVSTVVSIKLLENQIPEGAEVKPVENAAVELAPRGKLVFATGILGLLSVPLFKQVTGLPPYLGMLSALGVMWTLTDAIHAGEGKEGREELMAPAALRKIDTSGVLFFMGILLSIGALDSAGILRSLAEIMDKNIPSETLIAAVIGIASSIIDNVPLVAATMGMYPISQQPVDSQLWQLIAFCAGTGGSILVIGSAAGVALMGLEKVDFVWYAKNISLAAFAGYVGGIGMYLLQSQIMN